MRKRQSTPNAIEDGRQRPANVHLIATSLRTGVRTSTWWLAGATNRIQGLSRFMVALCRQWIWIGAPKTAPVFWCRHGFRVWFALIRWSGMDSFDLLIVKAVSYPAPHQWGAAVRLLGCNVRTGRWGERGMGDKKKVLHPTPGNAARILRKK